jgi:hypothetical protein
MLALTSQSSTGALAASASGSSSGRSAGRPPRNRAGSPQKLRGSGACERMPARWRARRGRAGGGSERHSIARRTSHSELDPRGRPGNELVDANTVAHDVCDLLGDALASEASKKEGGARRAAANDRAPIGRSSCSNVTALQPPHGGRKEQRSAPSCVRRHERSRSPATRCLSMSSFLVRQQEPAAARTAG